MAGHSKWANIKRHKAKQDAKRGKVYTKIIREVTVAARMGGGDSSANPRLRAALDKAQEANISKDVIERAIKRGAGGMEGEVLEERNDIRERFMESEHVRIGWFTEPPVQTVQQRVRRFMGNDVVRQAAEHGSPRKRFSSAFRREVTEQERLIPYLKEAGK